MKEFFKMFGAVMAGIFVWMCIASFMFFFMMLMFMISGASSGSGKTSVAGNSILRLDLSKAVGERAIQDYSNIYSSISFSNIEVQGLNDIQRAISKAAADSKITALYIDCSNYNVPDPATAEAIRNMIVDFRKESGKPVYAFSHDFSNFDYYIATAADTVFMRSRGDFALCGMASQLMYYKGALDKFGISAQVIRHGKFKAAVEPFLQETMSQENREQISTYLGDFWNEIASSVSESRNISREKIDAFANSLELLGNNDLCVKEGFLDGIVFENELKKRLEEELDSKFVSIKTYNNSFDSEGRGNSRIAVIYADGEIGTEAGSGVFTSKEIVEAIDRVKDDEDVKAVVLRINSPGGSAVEAEIIHHELMQIKGNKPLVVSMGGYAASGGYYIAAPADVIYAQNNTVTGSIGVFGLVLQPDGLLKNTLGINLETVSTHKHSGMMSSLGKMPSDEIEILQNQVEDVYDLFVSHVAEGRSMSWNDVDAIAQGRVWTGASAKNIGLVDQIGGLNDAINCAADLADIKSFKIIELPEATDGLTKLLNDLMETSSKIYMGEEVYKQTRMVSKIKSHEGVQAYLPVSKVY